MTNFATFIDSANGRAPIAQRGKAKQKRTDLRLVGLALVITRDGGMPLVSHAYPGDRPDVTQFSDVIDELVARYRQLVPTVESLTVVYDAGQNSTAQPRATRRHRDRVRRIAATQRPPGTARPRPRTGYRDVDPDRYPGVTCVDTTVTALGVTRRAVLTHSPTLHAKQSRGFDQTLAKAARKLDEPASAPRPAGRPAAARRPSQADIATILKPRWVNEVITVTLTGDEPSEFRLTWRTDAARPEATGTTTVRQTDPVHQPRRLAHRRRRRRLPLPVRSRRRIPATQRPPRRVVLPDAPLDRPENPRPRLLLRPRPDHRPPDAPRKPTTPAWTCPSGNCCTNSPASEKPCCSTTTAAKAAPRPTHAHRHDPHPTTLADLFNIHQYAPTR